MDFWAEEKRTLLDRIRYFGWSGHGFSVCCSVPGGIGAGIDFAAGRGWAYFSLRFLGQSVDFAWNL